MTTHAKYGNSTIRQHSRCCNLHSDPILRNYDSAMFLEHRYLFYGPSLKDTAKNEEKTSSISDKFFFQDAIKCVQKEFIDVTYL